MTIIEYDEEIYYDADEDDELWFEDKALEKKNQEISGREKNDKHRIAYILLN